MLLSVLIKFIRDIKDVSIFLLFIFLQSFECPRDLISPDTPETSQVSTSIANTEYQLDVPGMSSDIKMYTLYKHLY